MLSALLLSLVIAAGEMAPAAPAPQPATSPAPAPAPATQRLAVLKMQAQGAAPEVAETLTQVIAEQAGRTPGFSAISQTEIASLLGVERQKQLLGCGDQACLAEIGGALGARLVLSGSLGKVGESYVLQLQLLDTQKAQIKARESRTINGPQSDLLAAARDLVNRVLLGKPLDTTGKIKLAVTPNGAKVVVDGQPMGLAPLATPLTLEQGTHRFHVEAEGYVPFDAAFDAIAGQTLFNAIDLTSAEPLTDSGRHRTQSALGWALIGVSVAALGAGIAFGALAQNSDNAYNRDQYKLGGTFNDGTIYSGAQQDKANTQTLSTVANFAYLGAGILGLAGIGFEAWSLVRSGPDLHTEIKP